MHIVGAAYDKCTGCSETVRLPLTHSNTVNLQLFYCQVLQAYEKEGFGMLLKAFNDPKYLPTLTGLNELYDEGEAAMESVDWDEEEDADF